MNRIRTLLVDDHHLFRQGLLRILQTQPDIQVVAEAASGLEAIEMAKLHQPDVAIVDIAMKELNGIEATSQMLRYSPKTAVLILSMYSDERYVMRAVAPAPAGTFSRTRWRKAWWRRSACCIRDSRVSVLR